MNGISSITNPFVGLRPFRSDESILFFGRQKQTMELLERLHRHQFVAVTGSSGCGKSSLIRAGLIPKLKAGYLVDDREKWMIAVMKPGVNPIANLANAILEPLKKIIPVNDAASLQNKIRNKGTDAILEELSPIWEEDFNFFLLVDQFEELFPDSDHKKNEINDEAIDFVNTLLELSSQKELPVFVVITMRSDYIGDCAQFYNLPEALNQSQYIVPKLNRIQLKSVIEGPVKLVEGSIQPGLTERLLNDAQNVKVELPLLQHVLMRIWEREKKTHQNGELDLDDYENIGGIEKALSNHAEEALEKMTPDEMKLTKKIFQSLTRIDERGRKTRRRVHLEDLEALTGKPADEILSIINRFKEDSRTFLVTDQLEDTNDLLIDISHESLINQWDRLNKWVDEEAESAKIFLRLADSAELNSRGEKYLLIENELHLISHWYDSFKPSEAWARRYKVDFNKSIDYLKESEKEERRQVLIKKWNRRIFLGGIVFITLLISAFAIVLFVNNIKRKRELALNYWNSSQSSRNQTNYLNTLHLIAAAAIKNDDKGLAQNLLIDAESFLPQTSLENIFNKETIMVGIVFSPDGKWMLTAANDGNAYLIDKATGADSLILKHNAPVRSAAFSPDGRLILTASNDRTSCVWDAVSGKKIRTLEHDVAVTDAVFSPDGKKILTAAANGFLRIWNADGLFQTDSLKHEDNEEGVASVAFSPDGKKILAAYDYGYVLIWDFTNADKPDTIIHSGHVRRAIFSPDGKKILTACDDHYARLWDATTKQQIDSLKHEAEVTNVEFSPDGKWILTASIDKTACLWEATTATRIGTAMKHEGTVYGIAFSPDGKQIATTGSDNAIRVWSVATDKRTKEKNIFTHPDIVNNSVFSPDGRKLLTACDDHYVRIWDVATGRQIDSFNHTGAVSRAVFSPDGMLMLAGCKDSTIHLWDIATKKKSAFLKQKSSVTSVAFSQDGEQILIGCENGNAYMWDTGQVYTSKTIASFPYRAYIHSAAISPDKKKVLIAGDNNSAILFNINPVNEQTIYRHDKPVTDAVFSPDGKWVLTASEDNTVRLWDVAGAQIGPPMKHKARVNSAVFSQGANLPFQILTAGFDMFSHLWSTETKKELGVGKKHERDVKTAVFSPDGKLILTSSQNNARIWEIEGDLDIPADLFQLQAQVATGVIYEPATGETECISSQRWKELKREYDDQAKDHYKVCKYPQYNWWRRFHND